MCSATHVGCGLKINHKHDLDVHSWHLRIFFRFQHKIKKARGYLIDTTVIILLYRIMVIYYKNCKCNPWHPVRPGVLDPVRDPININIRTRSPFGLRQQGGRSVGVEVLAPRQSLTLGQSPFSLGATRLKERTPFRPRPRLFVQSPNKEEVVTSLGLQDGSRIRSGRTPHPLGVFM